MKWYWWVLGVSGIVSLGFFNRKRVVSNLQDVNLSENFALSEFVKTRTGIDNIPGPTEVANLRALVANFFQPLREVLGLSITITSGYRSPLVNSSTEGSAKNSQHMKGEAGDFVVIIRVPRAAGLTEAQAKAKAAVNLKHLSGTETDLEPLEHTKDVYIFKLTNAFLIKIIRANGIPYDQLIDEQLIRGGTRIARWIHASYTTKGKNRMQWLTARDKPGGGTLYTEVMRG